MKYYRFKFQWFTPDLKNRLIPIYSIEFSIPAYNSLHAQERAVEKVEKAGYSDDYLMEFLYVEDITNET